ncbi:MAG: amino acid permease [Simkaniaceae bacterium]|nr:amino acid permease [Simkaniaceae bacterium]
MEIEQGNNKRVISLFVLTMLNVSIMASLRNLPLVAEFGYSSIFFFFLAGLLFLIPCALVSAELATGWPHSGGIYIWVREAFGDRWGFFAIWMQWVHNVTWYPAILSFVATTLTYVIFGHEVVNRLYTFLVIIICFWGMTLMNYLGIRVSTLFSTIGVIGGTIVPGIFIIYLGVQWLATGQPAQIQFSWNALVPEFNSLQNLVFLGGLFLAFAGLEVSAGYAGEVKEPQKNYPRSIIFGALITFLLFMLGSLAIAFVIPKSNISLVAGLMEAFQIFLIRYNLTPLLPILGILLIIGAIAEVNSWIIGPVKALFETAEHGDLHPLFQRQNKHGMPTNLLLFQAIIVTLVACVFLVMPDLSISYWILSALSIQIYLAMYLFMFAAAIRLRYTHSHVERAYSIPHPHKGMWVVACVGILASLFAFLLVYVPPAGFEIGSLLFYELFLIIGFVVMAAIPIILHAFKKPEWDPTHEGHFTNK